MEKSVSEIFLGFEFRVSRENRKRVLMPFSPESGEVEKQKEIEKKEKKRREEKRERERERERDGARAREREEERSQKKRERERKREGAHDDGVQRGVELTGGLVCYVSRTDVSRRDTQAWQARLK